MVVSSIRSHSWRPSSYSGGQRNSHNGSTGLIVISSDRRRSLTHVQERCRKSARTLPDASQQIATERVGCAKAKRVVITVVGFAAEFNLRPVSMLRGVSSCCAWVADFAGLCRNLPSYGLYLICLSRRVP